MTNYYQKGTIYVAVMEKSEISVYLNDTVKLGDYNMDDFYIKNDYTPITSETFNIAYRLTQAKINEEYSRLQMLQTDELLPQATEQEKREEHTVYPTGEHMEFDC